MKANVRGPGRRGDDLDGLRAAYVASTHDGHSAWCVCGVEIRSLMGILTRKQLGEMYGIAPSTVSGIWTGNTWGGVE